MDTFSGLVPRRQLSQLCRVAAAPAPPGWLRLSSASRCRDDPSVPHTGVSASVSMPAWQPGSCASVQPGSEGETCSTLHKKCKCRCSGPLGPWGSRCCCCIPLARGVRVAKPAAWRARWARRDARRAGEPGAFQGKYRPSPPASGSPTPPCSLTPAGRLSASTCVPGEARGAGARAARGGMPCVRAGVCAGCPAVAAPEQEAPDAGTAV